MRVLEVVSHSEEQTIGLAGKLAASFQPTDLVVLKGQLGSGKTVFVRGLAMANGINESKVSSPSFTFVNEYPGPKPVYHFDLYRMKNVSELEEIGWDEYLNRDGLVVVEWGERAAERLPRRYYLVELEVVSDEERRINISLVDDSVRTSA